MYQDEIYYEPNSFYRPNSFLHSSITKLLFTGTVKRIQSQMTGLSVRNMFMELISVKLRWEKISWRTILTVNITSMLCVETRTTVFKYFVGLQIDQSQDEGWSSFEGLMDCHMMETHSRACNEVVSEASLETIGETSSLLTRLLTQRCHLKEN